MQENARKYDYLTMHSQISSPHCLKWQFSVHGVEFSVITETKSILVGRNAFEYGPDTGGQHVLRVHECARFQLLVCRPAGQPDFATVPRMPGDVSRIGVFGLKKLSRNHLYVRTRNSLISAKVLGSNGVLLGGQKIVEGQTAERRNSMTLVCNDLELVIRTCAT